MIGLIRTIFFIVVVYYLVRFIARVLVPYFRAVTEINERQKRDGEVSVRQPSGPAPKKQRSVDGEYVDYKEVE